MSDDSASLFLDFTDECSENVSELELRPISGFHSDPYGVNA